MFRKAFATLGTPSPVRDGRLSMTSLVDLGPSCSLREKTTTMTFSSFYFYFSPYDHVPRGLHCRWYIPPHRHFGVGGVANGPQALSFAAQLGEDDGLSRVCTLRPVPGKAGRTLAPRV